VADGPSGRGARYWVLAVLGAVVGTAVVVVLYDRGVLPITGPFVLLALMPLLWPLFERGQRAKAEREARRRGR
jgi:glycerol uptake facilitator-like aquaporin